MEGEGAGVALGYRILKGAICAEQEKPGRADASAGTQYYFQQR
jgi:hypothetical protein